MGCRRARFTSWHNFLKSAKELIGIVYRRRSLSQTWQMNGKTYLQSICMLAVSAFKNTNRQLYFISEVLSYLIWVSSCCHTGDDVLVVGHPVFDSALNMGLTVTQGVVARVTSVGPTPVMIQVSDFDTNWCRQLGTFGGVWYSEHYFKLPDFSKSQMLNLRHSFTWTLTSVQNGKENTGVWNEGMLLPILYKARVTNSAGQATVDRIGRIWITIVA